MVVIGARRAASVRVVASVLALTGCGSPASSSDDSPAPASRTSAVVGSIPSAGTAVDGPVMRYPQASTDPMAPQMAALVEGTLQLEGNCLYLHRSDADERYPILWPAGTTWDDAARSVTAPTGATMPVGSDVHGGGGYLYVPDIERLAGPDAAALAQSCVDNTYGEIAVVNNADSAIEPADQTGTTATSAAKASHEIFG